MAAVPKRRISSSKRRHRRAQTFKSPELVNLVRCPECGERVRPYHVCMYCGTYRGRHVLEIVEE